MNYIGLYRDLGPLQVSLLGCFYGARNVSIFHYSSSFKWLLMRASAEYLRCNVTEYAVHPAVQPPTPHSFMHVLLANTVTVSTERPYAPKHRV